MTDVESRLARLEERTTTLQDNYVQTRLAHEDLNQRIEINNITLAQMNQRFIGLEASITHLQVGIDKLDKAVSWVVKLVLGSVVLALLGIVVSGSLQHIK